MHEHDALISEYSHERSRPREAEALLTLRKVASLVKPIMRQRGWRVGVLTEFYPSERNLLGLNWNRGQKICLRLRYPSDERQFLPIENVVDTMLHELAHIVHGPHDAAFHALWDQLRDEHEALVRKGYTGEGFLATGRKLGGSNRVPMSEARRLARQAAEQRRGRGGGGGALGGGQKLGGASVRRGTDIRAVIADAAQRRINVTQGCAGTVDNTKRRGELVEEASKNGFRTKAEEDDANERAIMDAYIELLQEEERDSFDGEYTPPSQQDPLGSQGRRKAAEERARAELDAVRGSGSGSGASSFIPQNGQQGNGLKTGKAANDVKVNNTPIVPLHNKPKSAAFTTAEPPLLAISTSTSTATFISASTSTASASVSSNSSSSTAWECTICTVLNPPLYLTCSVCGTERLFDDDSALSAALSASSAMPPPPQARTNTSSSNSLISSTTVDRSLRAKRSRDTLQQLARLDASVQARPLGWTCSRCGTFMEHEFWSCGRCGWVKDSS